MPLLEGRVSPELEIWSEGGCAHVLKKGVRTLPPTYRCASVRAWLLTRLSQLGRRISDFRVFCVEKASQYNDGCSEDQVSFVLVAFV